jgi:hypothetical protein
LTKAGEGAQHGSMIRPATWTIHRVSGAGCAAGLVALVLWLLYAAWPDIIWIPFVAALSIAAGCGIAMLLMTLADIKRRSGRGSRLRPIRTFDLLLGLLLSVPSLIELRAILPAGLIQFGL